MSLCSACIQYAFLNGRERDGVMATVIVSRCQPLGVCDACEYHTAHVSKQGKSLRTTAPVRQIEAWLTTVLGQGDQINDNYSVTRSPLLTSSLP